MGTREPQHLVPNPITVSRCHIQTANDRFGDDGERAVLLRDAALRHPIADYPFTSSTHDNWPYYSEDPDFEGPDLPDSSIWKRVPTMQQYRNNLTALSQEFNLYFVAYRNRIFVYRPTSIARQRLSEHPELQLLAPETSGGRLQGGYIEYHVPQTINAVKVGHLGDQEIIVAAYDNGDVNIWMTTVVAKEVMARQKARQKAYPSYVSDSSMSSVGDVPPFHSTHMGISAWGIDIHRQSRLVAVSTNAPSVFIIAPGLRKERHFTSRHKAKGRLPLRDDDCRIDLHVGLDAQNIPNVCFLDDEDGDADKVCAQDIGGNTWFINIWKPHRKPYRIPTSTSFEYMRSEEFYPNRPRGWGLLIVPDLSFMEVKHQRQLVGLDLPGAAPELPGEKYPLQQRFFEFGAGLLKLPDYPARGHVDTANLPLGHLGRPFAETFNGGTLDWLDTHSEEESENQDNAGEEEPEEGVEELLNEAEPEETAEDGDVHGEGEATVLTGAELDEQLINAIALVYQTGGVSPSPGLAVDDDPMSEDDAGHAPVTETQTGPPASPGAQWSNHSNGRSSHQYESSSVPAGPSPGRKNKKKRASKALGLNRKLDKAARISPQADKAVFVSWDPFSEPEVEETPQVETTHRECSYSYTPSLGMRRNDTTGRVFRDWYPKTGHKLAPRVGLSEYLPDDGETLRRIQILRTYEDSIELRCLDERRLSDLAMPKSADERGQVLNPEIFNSRKEREIGFVCDKVMPFGLFRRPRWDAAFRATGRLNMIFHVPELQLVVLGSPTGRVALVTPTKLKERMHPGDNKAFWEHGFQIEMVLPRRSEEEQFRQKPCPLHGIAIAPLQESTKLRAKEPTGRRTHEQRFPTKFRLVLHYRDHSIWTYVLSRKDVQDRERPLV